jgi:hypothetical protein
MKKVCCGKDNSKSLEKLAVLREKFPSVDNIYRLKKDKKADKTSGLFRLNQTIYQAKYSMRELVSLLSESKVTEDEWRVILGEEEIYQRIKESLNIR